jgi:sigma-B regulation protein RsbU (phosphoserine phosphatase)
MSRPTEISQERSAALAVLIRELATAPDAVRTAQFGRTALRRSFASASAVHVHELPEHAETPLSLLGEPDPLDGCLPALEVMRQAVRERASLAVLLPSESGVSLNDEFTDGLSAAAGNRSRLVVAPMLYGELTLGTLALTLPASTEWTAADADWLSLLAQQVGLGLSEARLRELQSDAERRYQEMSEAIEARAQARLEQLAGRGKQLEALFQLSTQISMTLEEAKVTAMALDHLLKLTESRVGFVVLVSSAGELELGCVDGVNDAEADLIRAALCGPLQALIEPVTIERHSLRQYEEVHLSAPDGGRSLRLESLLAVPLSCGNRPLGALVLAGRLPGYDEADERLVSMFGFQVAVAVQNARMVAKIEGSLQTRHRELGSLSRTAQELAMAADESAVLKRVVSIIQDTFEARAAWVMLRDGSGGMLRMRNYQGAGQESYALVAVPDDHGMVGEALRSLRPVFRSNLCGNVTESIWAGGCTGQALATGGRGAADEAAELETMLCVPLVVQERALGVLGIDSARFSERRPPRPQDLDLIQAFASQAAVAIENARLMEAAVRGTRRERLLNAITDAVRESMAVGDILGRAVERLGSSMEVSRCVALLPQENGEYVEYAWAEPGFELPPDGILWESCPVVQRLEETGHPLNLPDPTQMTEFSVHCEGLEPPLSLLGIPAIRSGKLVALFLFHQCDRRREWTEDDFSLAQRVVAQVAVAVENAHLYGQELEQEKFQRTMAEIASAVGSSVDLTQVLRAVGEQGMRLLDADAAYIWRLDDASRELVSIASVGHKAEKFQNLRLALTRRSFHAVRAVNERRPIAAKGIGLDRQASQRFNRMFDCQSLLAVPLIVRDHVIGVVQFSGIGVDTGFDADQVEQAEILVAQAAAAMENAQLYEAERNRAEELEVLWRISQGIAENLHPDQILPSIVAGARQVLGLDAASLMMFEEDDETLAIAAQEGLSTEHVSAIRFRRGERIPRCIAIDGAHRVTTNLGQDPHYPPIAGQEGLQSMLSVPMLDEQQVVGALNVYARRRRQFRIEEAQKLGLLASFAMAALRQARQFQREHQIAQAFQRDLLPELKLDVAGFEVARKSIAALPCEADVGGDLYDVHRISETQYGLVIGDVSGKGLAAAPQTAMVKCIVRAFAFEASTPSQVLERLNHLLYRTSDVERFVSLFYGLLDVEKKELTYANAGHELPLVLRRGSGSPELLVTTGPVLGLDSESRYRQVTTAIGSGDALVLYTDGFTDARRGNSFLQLEGLASLLGEVREETAGHMVESVSQSVAAYSGGALRDDATIVVVKNVA